MPLRGNRAGQYILSAVDFRKGPSRNAPKCPEASAPFACLASKYPDLSGGGRHLPYIPVGFFRFETPHTFATYKAVTLGDTTQRSLAGPKKIAMQLHVNWGHGSA